MTTGFLNLNKWTLRMVGVYVKMELAGFLCFLICLIGLYSYAEGLQCYACSGTGSDSDCEYYDTYLDAWDGKKPGVLRNCTSPHDQICYIETYTSGQGQTLSHIRDCNNGSLFSFTFADRPVIYTRLSELATNNQTTCVWDGISMVCLSKCNTDFCNGPIEIWVNSATEVTSWRLLWCMVIGVCVLIL